MSSPSILENLLLALPSLSSHHAPTSRVHAFLKEVARTEVEKRFSEHDTKVKGFNPFGDLVFPYHKMGAIDSLDLFDLDELILFIFYWINSKRYRRVLDIGANIGLHSIILSRCGFAVRAYEPDPRHFEILQRNLALNNCFDVEKCNAAVSKEAGVMEFVRVLGNTTASHLAGSKPDPYGELERCQVKVEAIESVIMWADLMKLDVEGHEKEILFAARRDHWLNTDALVEVNSKSNAADIYEYFRTLGVGLFSQKTNWRPVRNVSDMPMSYREGTLFVTCKSKMHWGE